MAVGAAAADGVVSGNALTDCDDDAAAAAAAPGAVGAGPLAWRPGNNSITVDNDLKRGTFNDTATNGGGRRATTST